jgi:LPXTG-motif cell wall-anchored protein
MRLVLAATCAATVLLGFAGRATAQAPTANPDSASTTFNTPVDIDVFANDFIPAGYQVIPPFIIILTSPEHGTAQVISATTVRYTPAHDFTGSDGFEYQLCVEQVSDASTQGQNCPIVTKAPVTVTVTGQPPTTTSTSIAPETTTIITLGTTSTSTASTTSTSIAGETTTVAPELPRTGSGSTPLGLVGLITVAAGGAAILGTRRARRRS